MVSGDSLGSFSDNSEFGVQPTVDAHMIIDGVFSAPEETREFDPISGLPICDVTPQFVRAAAELDIEDDPTFWGTLNRFQ